MKSAHKVHLRVLYLHILPLYLASCCFLLCLSSPGAAEDETSFLDVCASGSPTEILFALDNGASVEDRDDTNFTPLMAAAISNSAAAINTLIQAGANVRVSDIVGLTALMYAAGNNTASEVCDILIKAGAEVNRPDYLGNTALMYAAINNKNPGVIRLLIEAGGNREWRNDDGYTAYDLAVEYDNIIAIEILRSFVP